MNKKQLCENSLSISYYSGFNGLEVKAIFQKKYSIMYVVSNAWNGKKKYHKLRIYSSKNGEYIRLNGRICYLDNFIKI